MHILNLYLNSYVPVVCGSHVRLRGKMAHAILMCRKRTPMQSEKMCITLQLRRTYERVLNMVYHAVVLAQKNGPHTTWTPKYGLHGARW